MKNKHPHTKQALFKRNTLLVIQCNAIRTKQMKAVMSNVAFNCSRWEYV